jgi:hypothetical protein
MHIVSKHVSSAALRILFVASSTTALGCFTIRETEGKAADPVPLTVAIADFEENLSRVGVLVLSDARVKDKPNKDASDVAALLRMKDVIANVQCYDWTPALDDKGKPRQTKSGHLAYRADAKLRTKNPLVPVVNGAIQIQVQGQFTESGTFSVSTTQGLSGGGTLTRQAQQQVMMPVALVSLANLDKFYIGQQLANLQYLTLTAKEAPFTTSPGKDDAGNPLAAPSEFVVEVLKVGQSLKEVAKDAMDGFGANPDTYCQGHGGRHGFPPGSPGLE